MSYTGVCVAPNVISGFLCGFGGKKYSRILTIMARDRVFFALKLEHFVNKELFFSYIDIDKVVACLKRLLKWKPIAPWWLDWQNYDTWPMYLNFIE